MEQKCKNCKYYAIMDKSEQSLCTLFLDKSLSDDYITPGGKRFIVGTNPGSLCEMFDIT